ncbi:MAG: SPOR domain-containing protein [Pseudomonadota bacterium]
MPPQPRTPGRRRPLLALVLALVLVLGLALLLTLAGCAGVNQGMQGDQAVGRAHYNRAMAFGQSHQLDRAAQELELAVKADPGMYFSYYQLGLVYEAQGRKEMARQTWEQGLKVAKSGPAREDYSRPQAIAEMESALVRIEPQSQLPPPTLAERPLPTYQPPPPKPRAKSSVRAKSSSGSAHGYAVLVSSNQKKASALADVKRLKAKGIQAKIATHKDKHGKTWYRVLAGGPSKAKAQSLAATLKKKGLAKSPQVVGQ